MNYTPLASLCNIGMQNSLITHDTELYCCCWCAVPTGGFYIYFLAAVWSNHQTMHSSATQLGIITGKKRLKQTLFVPLAKDMYYINPLLALEDAIFFFFWKFQFMYVMYIYLRGLPACRIHYTPFESETANARASLWEWKQESSPLKIPCMKRCYTGFF